MLEQPALARQASAVSREGAVRADHAMAGHDDADGIERVGARNRANGIGDTQALCQRPVAHNLPRHDPTQFRPDFALELRPAAVRRDIVGSVGISGDSSANDELCAVAGINAAGLVPDTGDPG